VQNINSLSSNPHNDLSMDPSIQDDGYSKMGLYTDLPALGLVAVRATLKGGLRHLAEWKSKVN
jgi:hypothetical protein